MDFVKVFVLIVFLKFYGWIKILIGRFYGWLKILIGF